MDKENEDSLLFLKQLNHEMSPIEQTIGIITKALADDDFEKEELKSLVVKAHGRLTKIQERIRTKVNGFVNPSEAGA